MADIWIPDVSEFQAVNFGVFSGPIIVRAHNSNRADYHWPQHAAGAAHQPWWGAYQYLTAGANPTAAAYAFITTLGGYSPNVVILDLEEGDGDQHARQHEWLAAVTGHPAWTYTGAYFARSHNLDNVQWLAAYQNNEPSTAHTLWQAADNHFFAGIGNCDGSIFHGTIDDLIHITGGNPAPAAKEPDDMPMTMVVPPATYPDGRPHPHAGSVYIVNGLLASHVSSPTQVGVYQYLGVGGPAEISAEWFDNLTIVPSSGDPFSTWHFTASIDTNALAQALKSVVTSVSDTDLARIAKAVNDELSRRTAT